MCYHSRRCYGLKNRSRHRECTLCHQTVCRRFVVVALATQTVCRRFVVVASATQTVCRRFVVVALAAQTVCSSRFSDSQAARYEPQKDFCLLMHIQPLRGWRVFDTKTHRFHLFRQKFRSAKLLPERLFTFNPFGVGACLIPKPTGSTFNPFGVGTEKLISEKQLKTEKTCIHY